MTTALAVVVARSALKVLELPVGLLVVQKAFALGKPPPVGGMEYGGERKMSLPVLPPPVTMALLSFSMQKTWNNVAGVMLQIVGV